MVDIARALNELTVYMADLLRSPDPRRFVIIHRVSRTATKLIQVTSLRVEDFEDPTKKRGGIGYFKERELAPDAAVPATLDFTAKVVLDSIADAISATLTSSRKQRFCEVERFACCALNFLVAASQPEPSKKEETEIGCEDPEAAYIREGLMHARPVDTEQLRREILEIEGTQHGILAEVALAKVAHDEAAELAHLVAALRDCSPDVEGALRARIDQLKEKIIFRTKGSNGVVSADVSRGHQPGREEARDDPPQGHPHAA